MLITDTDITRISYLDCEDVLAWLRQYQPEMAQERPSWWENLTIRVLQKVYRPESAEDRSRFSRLASLAIREAVDQGVVDSRAGAIRLANLAGFYFAHGGDDYLLFDADQLVTSCLDLIEISIDRAKSQAGHWQSLSISEIRKLRYAKNLVTACDLIGGQVRNPHIAERLTEWLNLCDQLP